LNTVGVVFEYFWGRLVDMALFWDRFGIVLDRFGIVLKRFWVVLLVIFPDMERSGVTGVGAVCVVRHSASSGLRRRRAQGGWR
jgi:hypothetical protein